MFTQVARFDRSMLVDFVDFQSVERIALSVSRDRIYRTRTFESSVNELSPEKFKPFRAESQLSAAYLYTSGLINDLRFVWLKFVNKVRWRVDMGSAVVLVNSDLIFTNASLYLCYRLAVYISANFEIKS